MNGPEFCFGNEATFCPPEYDKTRQFGYPVAFKTQVIHLTDNPYRSDIKDASVFGHETNLLHFIESVALWSILGLIGFGTYKKLATKR